MIHEPSLRTLDTRELLRHIVSTRADVASMRYWFVITRAEREQMISASLGQRLGATESERERALTLALTCDDAYQNKRVRLLDCENDLMLLEAEWDARRYELRCREVAAAERRTEAAAWAIVDQLENE